LDNQEKVHIIGIGDDGLAGLTDAARALLERADIVAGPPSALSLLPAGDAEHVVVGDNFDAAIRCITNSPRKRIVVLASGDPLFYGVARYLCSKLGKDRFEVVPHVSSMQLAFARVKESWEDAFLTNLAARPFASVLDKVRVAETVGMFTSDDWPPAAIARTLLDSGIDYFSAYVCENLGSPDERVTQGELSDLLTEEFSPLNVMILVRKPDVPDRPREAVGLRLFGNPDELFEQSQPKYGLLTPQEVRAIALAELDLGPRSVVWDVGAGSGSVAIEAAQIAAGGSVYAIEMDPEDHALIVRNAERFRVANLTPVLGRAPEAWEGLPKPDAIFVGGSGREISRLIELAYAQLRPAGRLVANVGSIESLSAVNGVLRRQSNEVKVWMINIARGTEQLERVRFDALNPSFVLSVIKPDK
jgi:precorrin-6Y C5,15-methyltransferase (decarboxylating)